MSHIAYKTLIWTANRLAGSYLKSFVRTFFKPIDYTRTREIPVLMDLSGILSRREEPLRILDIGSPQILSLALCCYSQQWQVVYVNQHGPELADITAKAAQLGVDNLSTRSLNIADYETLRDLGKFDVIFSCSVFEHIHPEIGGDATAAANIHELLNDGGSFAFSVPFYHKAFNEYKKGDVYAVKGKENEPTFFQRFYDENSLRDHLIKPTNLKVTSIKFVGERYYYPDDINRRLAFMVDYRKYTLLIGRAFRYISAICMCESEKHATLRKPYLAFCVLTKGN